MSDTAKKSSAKKSTIKKSSGGSTNPLKEESPSKTINHPKEESVKTEFKAGMKGKVSEVDQLKLEFETITKKFDSIEDPINRYIARQDMRELQEKLKEYGINVNIP
jgi:esterase/lipase